MGKQKSILVVDDDQEMLTMLDNILKLGGYYVTAALDGTSALSILESHRPDLVILDIVMPGLDGLQVLNLIRQRHNLPVIMLSGRREVTTVRDALVLGADDYVRKPVRARELLARVKAKLRRVAQ